MFTHLLITLHVDGCDGEVSVLRAGEEDLRSSILGAIEFEIRDPALFQTLSSQIAKVLVHGISRAVVGVQISLKVAAGCTGFLVSRSWKEGREGVLQRACADAVGIGDGRSYV